MSINIARNIDDPCGFGWIRASGMSPSSVIVTEGKGILMYEQEVLQRLLGTGLRYSFVLRSWLFDVDAVQRGADRLSCTALFGLESAYPPCSSCLQQPPLCKGDSFRFVLLNFLSSNCTQVRAGHFKFIFPNANKVH